MRAGMQDLGDPVLATRTLDAPAHRGNVAPIEAVLAVPLTGELTDDTELREARQVCRVGELVVCDRMPPIARRIGGDGGFDAVEHLPRRTVADRVHVHVDALR